MLTAAESGYTYIILRKFQLCRFCFGSLLIKGGIPGVIKESW
ncbi:hypothetical protein [Cytobacillus solani]